MHLRHNRSPLPTRDVVERIKELALRGEGFFDNANLRPQDEVWWAGCTSAIAEGINTECDIRDTTDAGLASKIPESDYNGCYNQAARDRVTQSHIAAMRLPAKWTLSVGFLLRDTERILMEGVLMGEKAIEARNNLRAIAWVIACETGMCTCVPDVGEEP